MSEDEDNEMGFVLEMQVNDLAAKFYMAQGRVYDPDLKFKESSYPEEVGCWNKACIAYCHIQEDPWFMQFQVEL